MNQESKTTQTPQPSHPTQTPQSPQSKTVDERPEPVSTATPTRKRQNDSDPDDRVPQPKRRRQIDSDVEPQPKRARLTRKKLTRKNLAEFNKMGKKKTSDPTDDSGSTKTKTTSTTSSGFDVRARKNGILDPSESKPPPDLEGIRKRHARSRATASPPESQYDDYVDRIEKAGNEATVVIETSEHILKKYHDKRYRREFNRAFTNYPKDAGFNDGLSAPQPDFVEGPEMRDYLPFPVDDRIPGATLYKDDPRSVTLPQIAGEWKGPSGDMREARMQAAYDGAALVHARTQALAHMRKKDPPGHAAATTFTTDGTNLNLYAHYAAPAEDDEDTLEYHQYPISSTNLTSSYEDFKKGRKQLRNAQDHAKAQSEQLRDQLKQHWKQNRTKLPPVAEGVHPPDVEPPPHTTDGYENANPHILQEEAEDEDDYEIVQPTTHKESSYHLKSSHRHHSSSHHSSPHHSSKSSHHSSSHSSSHKRKAPSSQTSSHGSSGHLSKHGSYWKKNSKGHYYHKHSDGTVTWYNNVKDHHRH
ncbi:hypothetical protein SPI_02810 [Niveomyces insectorum RCEF 264]|uniref:DUF7924 domain-containing protein n=1 Tax=Niveomyces insectorum RCEF 264 TaxID=1081102 RepID=A0A167WSY4_9HYPO|nr:hypothetical protein SPI_02810 [Niveomyces insectorum RCEF 264]